MADYQSQFTAGGSHQGASTGATHDTVPGALAGGLKSAIKGENRPDPQFTAQSTVAQYETQQPVSHRPDGHTYGVGEGPGVQSTTDVLEVLCGPLINYRRMSGAGGAQKTWYGSVLIVTKPGQSPPELRLRCVGPATNAEKGGYGGVGGESRFVGLKLYEDRRKAFWKFPIEVPFQNFEARWEYTIPRMSYQSPAGTHSGASHTFVVSSLAQSFRILFHSCNGFSVGTDTEAWSGPALWNDVLRHHEEQPFHVMIGGGDQIYNDGVRVDGPLKSWTVIGNPRKRREFPFNEELRAQCDQYYFDNYVRWYSTEPFKSANGQIPQINIWDDHDIIDGFGSYTDRFMRCPVFRGIGGVAHKYYMLFQHHLAPPKSTFTTDAPHTMDSNPGGTTKADPVQLEKTFVSTEQDDESAYIMGPKPGPYVQERSRSIYAQLGARIAFLGIDARQERTRHQINYPETYDLIFNRVEAELRANTSIKHLILLLGVPIAYPRLQWLENIFSSPILGPIRFLNKRFGFAGSFFNHFDGQVDLLDDLDDHYTAHQHKHERTELIHRLQELARAHSVRITILGGDVHLCAIGRFYSKPDQGIPAERDWRYMVNVVSSAITNKPPPQAIANLLARRNKIHHLDHETDETLLECFDRDPGVVPGQSIKEKDGGPGSKTSKGNHCTMPSRNYAIIAESHDPESIDHGGAQNGHLSPDTAANTNGAALDTTPSVNGSTHPSIRSTAANNAPILEGDKRLNPRHPLHIGEIDAGTRHPAASGMRRTGLGGRYGLDITLRVEISNKDPQGHTDGYGISIPGLDASAFAGKGVSW